MNNKQEKKHYAKKSLGQNFLTSEKITKKIVDAVSDEKTILEIGPGKGMLTKFLLEKFDKVVAIEKDDNLFEELQKMFREQISSGQLKLQNNDILKFSFTDIKGDYVVVGNIPYNITGQIFRYFLTSDHKPKSMVLMVQKEVGERILAKSGKESVLSLSIKAYGKPYIVKSVPKRHFLPKPKVDSVVIKIDEISGDFFQKIDEDGFFEFVKTGFKEKRKKLINNLSELHDKENLSEVFDNLGIDKNIRAEDLSLNNWRDILISVNS